MPMRILSTKKNPKLNSQYKMKRIRLVSFLDGECKIKFIKRNEYEALQQETQSLLILKLPLLVKKSKLFPDLPLKQKSGVATSRTIKFIPQ